MQGVAVEEMSGTVSRRLCTGKWRWSKRIPGKDKMNEAGKGEAYSRDST